MLIKLKSIKKDTTTFLKCKTIMFNFFYKGKLNIKVGLKKNQDDVAILVFSIMKTMGYFINFSYFGEATRVFKQYLAP
jgi:hypothetical protein